MGPGHQCRPAPALCTRLWDFSCKEPLAGRDVALGWVPVELCSAVRRQTGRARRPLGEHLDSRITEGVLSPMPV